MLSRFVHSLLLTLALLLGLSMQVYGQVTSSSKYTDASYTFIHRAGHWYNTSWRGQYTAGSYTEDTFDEDGSMTTAPEGQVQNTHVYVDTVYMQKGQTVSLTLPILWKTTGDDYSAAASAYIRWYNYRTGATFSYTKEEQQGGGTVTTSYDLLYPTNSPTMYRDTNHGYFGGVLFGGSNKADYPHFKFYYPTDTEAASMSFNTNDNDDYIVACDISPYPDGTLSGTTLTEPSLSQRVIFYISGMSNDEDDLDDSDDRFWQFIKDCRTTDATTGKTNSELAVNDPAKKYYVTYDIDFPFTRFDTRASKEMVVLNKSVDHYFAPGATQDKLTVTLIDNNSGIKLINDSGNEINDASYTKTTSSNVSPRCIRFSYPKTNTDSTTKSLNTQEVNNEDATATIYVTNSKGDGLARFNLTFTKGQRLLTQSEINSLEKGKAPKPDITVAQYGNRTPSYLENNYQLVTKLDMNYNPAAEDIAAVQSNRTRQEKNGDWSRTGTGVYPFPMNWSYSSYGFMDGSNVWEGHSESVSKGNFVAEWGEYSFVNKYIFDDHTLNDYFPIAKVLPNGDTLKTKILDGKPNYYSPTNYFLYVDAAAEPGVIARIPFRESLCSGAELFLTGWVKNGTDENKDNVDAAILMSIVAARVDANGNEKDTRVISRHSTGMFPHTSLCSRYGGENSTRAALDTTATEEWLQFFYSFTMPPEPFKNLGNDESITYYLELQNNAGSSSGADYYLDDICVYMTNPTVEVTQVTPTCSSTDTRMQVKFDYDMLLSRFGLEDETTLAKASRIDINFAMIDSLRYNDSVKIINARTDLTNVQKNDERAYLFKRCRVKFATLKNSTNADGTTSVVADAYDQRQTLVFYNSYIYMQGHTDGNASGDVDETVKAQYYYDDSQRGYNASYTPDPTTAVPNPHPRWRILTENGKRYIVADISVGDGHAESALQAGHTYIFAMASSYDASSSTSEGNASESEQIKIYDAFVDPCGYKRAFTPQGSLILQTTGQIVTPDMSFCTGQINNFTAKLRIYNNGVQKDIIDGYFDWFFDKESVFTAENPDYGNVTLKDALYQLREIFPDLTLTQLDTLRPVKKANNEITQEMIDLIKYYTEQESEEFLNPMLVLHEQAANMRISLANGEIVVYPSPIVLTGTDMACFDPIAITFTVEGTAPELHLGYDGETYPKSVQAGLRLGLTQIKSHTASANPIILPLRGVDMGDTKTEGVDHLGIVKPDDSSSEGGNDLRQIFLVSTDDPFFNIKQDGQYSNPIGELDKLFAVESTNAKASDNTLRFHFNSTFTDNIREGYTYNVKIWFGEVDIKDKVINTATGETTSQCYGSIVIPIRIVPEYLRWAGSPTDNWNNDDHWKRSLGSEIYKNSNTYTDSEHYVGDYLDYRYDTLNTKSRISTDYYCKGFVPMNFSYVTIPDSAQVELYAATAKTSGSNILNLAPTTKPSTILSATKNIEYDLVYKEKTASSSDDDHHTEPYYSNTVKQVHFRPAAEMLHAEYLSYSRAWVDMKLPTAVWSLVSTPFAQTYSGEFYTTPTDGLQHTELFLPITFTGAGVTYDRFAPAIYLRSYVGSSAIRLDASDGSTTSMAMTGRWSGVYNKVNRELAVGQAFSVKPVKGNADGVGDSVIVRLPKDDDSYYYYEDGSNTGSQNTPIDKDETGGTTRYSLAAYDGILPDGATTTQTFSAKLTNEIEPLPTGGSTTDQWYILGNPFVSHLNLTEFFKVNTAFDATTYMTADGVASAVTSSTLIPPLSAFYARLAGATLPSTLSYTADMEALRATSTTTSGVRGLRLTAMSNGHTSSAFIVTDAAATADYQAGEDYEVFVPDADELPCPVVYTVAGNVATTVNRTASLSNIPIGLIGGENDDEVSVRFDFEGLGAASSLQSSQSKLSEQSRQSKQSTVSTVSNFSNVSTEAGETGETTLSLYDAVLSTTTSLEPGAVVTLQANAHGRYFLNLGAAPVAETNISIYSANRELVVSSTADPLTRVEVYTPDGRRVLTATPSTTTFTTQLPTGIYIVRAATSEQQARGKVRL